MQVKLSDLLDGEKAFISKINGSGAFRKRIIEMGFIVGKEIEAIKRAPMQDPAEYNIMGYHVSIRRKDAELIDITEIMPEIPLQDIPDTTFDRIFVSESKKIVEGNRIHVALVGNPNCGKTTIFNHASNSRERVANYSGVTVAAKEASMEFENFEVRIVDLPGTYSLSSYTPEEIYVIDYLTAQKPDVVVNVVDASNLERNLFLTTQLLDLGHKVVIALNMSDELKRNGDKLNHQLLGSLIGVPIIPTVGTDGTGIDILLSTIVKAHKGEMSAIGRMQLGFGLEIDKAVNSLIPMVANTLAHKNFPNVPERFFAIKLLENDKYIMQILGVTSESDPIVLKVKEERQRVEKLYKQDLTCLIADARYGFITGAIKETMVESGKERMQLTRFLDSWITNRFLGIPLFFAFIWLAFYSTFKIGEYPVAWIESLIGLIASGVEYAVPAGIVKDLLIDGVIGGVGGVIVFLPSIMILFLFISFMEDTGYMARTAFLMDKAMHKMGLHGKSFIPMLMGFGCNVPAVMATRTIESRRDRILTMMVIPFMSCSARLPVYVLFISAFFPVYKSGILFGVYLFGILAAFLTALLLSKTVLRKSDTPFVMELPPYRLPTLKAVSLHMWFKSAFFLKKMGTIILIASIIIWALGYFPRNSKIEEKYNSQIAATELQYTTILDKASNKEKDSLLLQKQIEIKKLEVESDAVMLEQSYICQMGRAIEPVFKPLGFDWKMSVSILTGVLAKEIVVSSMSVLYHADNEADENSVSLVSKLQEDRIANSTPLYVYIGFLLFILLYFPCIGTLSAIRKETSNMSWTLFNVVYTTSFAWIVAFLVYIIGNFLF